MILLPAFPHPGDMLPIFQWICFLSDSYETLR